MTRSTRVFNLFRFSVVLIMVLGGILALMGRNDRAFTLSTMKASIICILLLAVTVFGRGSISIVYVRLLKWVLQRLHTTENHRWVIALGITALCDVFMDTSDMFPFTVLSALSMIMICVVAAGWDSDSSGMTEGLLIGFGKLLLVNMISLQLLPSVLCAAVLALAIVSKITEPVVGTASENPIHGASADSTSGV